MFLLYAGVAVAEELRNIFVSLRRFAHKEEKKNVKRTKKQKQKETKPHSYTLLLSTGVKASKYRPSNHKLFH